MRSVLVGAVESTRHALRAMAASGAAPEAVLTLAPGRRARHSDWVDLRPDALAAGCELVHIVNVNDDDVHRQLVERDLDAIYVIGWSQMCGPAFLSAAKAGVVGYHPSALPRNRGRAVIPWTILMGLEETGATLFRMDEGMDSGNILAQATFSVAADETARSLYDKHLGTLGRLLAQQMEDPMAPGREQDQAEATYCSQRLDIDGLIDWRLGARDIWTLVRATTHPYPGAFAYHRGSPVRVWAAELMEAAPYTGVPGQVQAVSPEGALVQCGDGRHLLLTVVSVGPDHAEVPAGSAFKVQDRFTSLGDQERLR